MKRLKIMLATVLSVLLCLSTAACAGGKGELVEGSFSYTCTPYYSFVSFESSFEISVSKAAEYKVQYTLTLYNDATNEILTTRRLTSNVTVSNTTTISDYSTYNYPLDDYDDYEDSSLYSVRLSDLSIERVEGENSYQSYAIGFGVTGGVLLIGSIAAFCLMQRKKEQ